jgi:hypothetical protein
METPETPTAVPWRQRIMPKLMAALRLVVVVLLFRGPFAFAFQPPAVLEVPLVWRCVFIALLIVGTPLFCAPRTVVWGGLLLSAAVGAYQILWREAGQAAQGAPWAAIALLGVLVLGELSGRAARLQLRKRAD